MKTYQAYNPKSKRWIKYKKMKNGKTRIVNVKQKNPAKKFAGVPVKRKR